MGNLKRTNSFYGGKNKQPLEGSENVKQVANDTNFFKAATELLEKEVDRKNFFKLELQAVVEAKTWNDLSNKLMKNNNFIEDVKHFLRNESKFYTKQKQGGEFEGKLREVFKVSNENVDFASLDYNVKKNAAMMFLFLRFTKYDLYNKKISGGKKGKIITEFIKSGLSDKLSNLIWDYFGKFKMSFGLGAKKVRALERQRQEVRVAKAEAEAKKNEALKILAEVKEFIAKSFVPREIIAGKHNLFLNDDSPFRSFIGSMMGSVRTGDLDAVRRYACVIEHGYSCDENGNPCTASGLLVTADLRLTQTLRLLGLKAEYVYDYSKDVLKKYKDEHEKEIIEKIKRAIDKANKVDVLKMENKELLKTVSGAGGDINESVNVKLVTGIAKKLGNINSFKGIEKEAAKEYLIRKIKEM